jgi:hypothetical protein
MNEELRNILGKTLYNASADFSDDDTPAWEELSEDTDYPWMHKSAWINRAETIVRTYIVEIARQEREIAEKLKREREGKNE